MKNISLFPFLLISVFYTNSLAFNVDISSIIVYRYPFTTGNAKSYFGFSVALYVNKRNAWVVIGAPKSNIIGTAFRCLIGDVCEEINVQESSYIAANLKKKHESWIGGTIDVDLAEKKFVICGHRWINYYKKSNDNLSPGICFWSGTDEIKPHFMVPLNDTGEAYTFAVKKATKYNYGQGQAGAAAYFAKEGEDLLLGSPGFNNWKGTVIAYKNLENYVIAKDFKGSSTTPGGLLGYSVASGKFYSEDELVYVAGAPRSDDCLGRVLLFRLNRETAVIEESITGHQLGEYFGSSFAVGDFNDDGLDDLVIGAPYHSSGTYNEGRIYVYLGSSKYKLVKPWESHVIDGYSCGAQFGMAITFLGDLDKDGYGDLAVGAPYEDSNSGTVYIYRGHKNGLRPKPSQSIKGKSIGSDVLGFGISISRPVDVDKNYYDDFAVGAYLSGHVVVLRTRPVVTIKHRIETNFSCSENMTNLFVVKTCFTYEGQHLNPTMGILRIITVSDLPTYAVLSEDFRHKKILTIFRSEEYCENFTLIVQKKVIEKAYTKITLEHKMLNADQNYSLLLIGKDIIGSDDFCPFCPIYNEQESSKPETIKIPILTADRQKCFRNSSLDVTAQFDTPNETFLVGIKDSLQIDLEVANLADDAYMAKLDVELPEAVRIGKIPSSCFAKNDYSLSCDIGNPLETKRKKSVSVGLDLIELNNGNYKGKHLEFKVTTNIMGNLHQTKFFNLKLNYSADITIEGRSEKQSYAIVDSQVTNFTQIVEVRKFGVSPIPQLNIQMKIPTFVKSPKGISKIASIIPDDHLHCKKSTTKSSEHILKRSFGMPQNAMNISCENNNFVCSDFNCTLSPIAANQDLTLLKLLIQLNVSALSFTETNLMTFTTNVSVGYHLNLKQSANISTILIGQPKAQKIQLWIIIVSAVSGLIILILISVPLIMMGFFKRKKKMELEALRCSQITSEMIPSISKETLDFDEPNMATSEEDLDLDDVLK